MDEITEDDNLIMSLIKAATTLIEKSLSRSSSLRTLKVIFQHNSCYPFRIPYGPIVSIEAIGYRGCDCRNLPFTPGDTVDYSVTGDQFCGKDGYYELTYQAGLGSDPEQEGELEAIKTMIKQQIGWMYENRGDNVQLKLNPAIALTMDAITQNDFI